MMSMASLSASTASRAVRRGPPIAVIASQNAPPPRPSCTRPAAGRAGAGGGLGGGGGRPRRHGGRGGYALFLPRRRGDVREQGPGVIDLGGVGVVLVWARGGAGRFGARGPPQRLGGVMPD